MVVRRAVAQAGGQVFWRETMTEIETTAPQELACTDLLCCPFCGGDHMGSINTGVDKARVLLVFRLYLPAPGFAPCTPH